jgi:hypothetical protein
MLGWVRGLSDTMQGLVVSAALAVVVVGMVLLIDLFG